MSAQVLIKSTEARAAYLAVRLVSVAEVLRLVPAGSEESGVDREHVDAALTAFARAGVGRTSSSLREQFTPEALAAVLEDVLAAVEASPMPDREWAPMSDVLGDELLASLVGVSISSAHRYRSGERVTPDVVAARVHVVALIVSDLAGSYNGFGIRRWFARSRVALAGRSPADILTGGWSPDDEDVQAVRDLAASLLGASAA